MDPALAITDFHSAIQGFVLGLVPGYNELRYN